MDYAIIYSRLVPGFEGTGCHYDNSFVWTDNRVQPTEQECIDEWDVYETEEAVQENNTTAWLAYKATIDAGFLHTDGKRYFCDERATSDLTKILTLYNLNPQEPVYVILFDKTLHSMSYAELSAMAEAVGQYQYTARQALWGSLL